MLGITRYLGLNGNGLLRLWSGCFLFSNWNRLRSTGTCESCSAIRNSMEQRMGRNNICDTVALLPRNEAALNLVIPEWR